MIEPKNLLPLWQAWAPERTCTIRVLGRAAAVTEYLQFSEEMLNVALDGSPVFVIHDEEGLPLRLCGELRYAVTVAAEHALVVARVDFG